LTGFKTELKIGKAVQNGVSQKIDAALFGKPAKGGSSILSA
jgi:hypothetical protein